MLQINDQLLLLILEWLDAADLLAFDTATQSNGRMSSTWLRVIRSHADIRPMRGLLYTPLWTRWLIDREVRTSSMRIAGGTTTDRITDGATQSNGCMVSICLRLIRRHPCIRPLRKLMRTFFSTRTSSMRIAGGTITDRVTDATFEGIFLPELTSIVVIGDHGCDLSDAGVRVIAIGCVNLLNIELADCRHLTCQSLAAIGQHCRALTSLDIRKCERINDDGVRALAQGCMYLQSLNLSQCGQLTNASLAAIGVTCKGLTTIDMSGNVKMTDVGIASLTKECS